MPSTQNWGIDFPEVWQLQVGALLLPRVPEGSLEGAQEEVPKKTFRNSACWENLLVVATDVATDFVFVGKKGYYFTAAFGIVYSFEMF